MILKNHASAPTRKERMSPTSRAKREAIRKKFAEKGGLPYRVESFGEVDSGKNRPESPARVC